MVLYLIGIIERSKKRQIERMCKYCSTSCNKNNDLFNDEPMTNFCLAMDNYFTLPNII